MASLNVTRKAKDYSQYILHIVSKLSTPSSNANQMDQDMAHGQANDPPPQAHPTLTCLIWSYVQQQSTNESKNGQVVNDGADSDHRAVKMQLNLTSLKYKEKMPSEKKKIDWRKICEEDEQRKRYNKYLLELTSRDMTYDNFCEAIMCAGRKTAISIEPQCRGWYAASESILNPAIEEKNRLRHQLQDTSNLTNDEIKDLQLKLEYVSPYNHQANRAERAIRVVFFY